MIRKLLLIIRSLFLKSNDFFFWKSLTPSVKLLCLGMFFVFSNNYGQAASSYCFTPSSSTYATLASVPGVSNVPGVSTNSTDDVISTPITLPFVFTFGGLGYGQVKISNNGWLTFGSTNDSQYDNTFANADSSKPILFPFWDDLIYANNNPPRYVTTGSAPNRIFKVEWVQNYFYNGGGSGDVISFQVWLYEGSNRIDYRYLRGGSNNTNNISASIGIYDSNGNYLSLNGSGASPTARTNAFTTTINARPANNTIYTFTPDVTSSLGGYEFCIDKTNTQTTGNASAGQYALVNVIKGFKYTFTVGDVFSGFNEKLNILDVSTGLDVSPATTSSGSGGTSIANWEAPFSGQIKVALSTGTCAGIGTAGTGGITLTLNSVGNKQDIQTSTPVTNNTWRGHIYNWTSTTLPPGGASPSALPTTTPFSDSEYVGYYDETAETITKNFGGDDVCFPVLSNGVQAATIRTEQFAVRYRMNSTKSGCYLVNVRADDGVRLYVDGVRVATQWGDQVATTYSNVLVNLTGTSVLVLDYYENAGANILEFSMTPFLASSNTIIAPASTTVCTGNAPGLIDGSSYPYNGTTVNPTIKFQWQSAPEVSGAPSTTWTNVTTGTGITDEDYTPAAITGNTTTNVTYYRRTVSAVASNASACSNSSAPVSITTNPKPVISDLAITVCSGSSFAITPASGGSVIVPANTTYSWELPSGTGFTGGAINSGTPLNITGNLVNTTNVNQTAVYTVTPTSSGCAGTPFKVTVTITPTYTVGAASSTPTLCINVPLTNSTYVTHTTTGATGIGAPSNLPTGLSATWVTNIITISGTPTVAGTFAYTIPLVGGCGTVSAAGSITISPVTVGGTAASTSCYTTSSNTATITLSGQTGNVIKWESSTDNFVSAPVAITNSTATLSGINVSTTTYYRAVVQSGNCSTSTSSVVKLVPGIAPTANNATLPTCNGFTANWAKVNGATSYLLSVSDDNFASTLSGYTNVDVGDNSSFSVAGLLPNKIYQYILKSVFSCGNYAAQSNVIVITTADLPITGAFTGGAPVICVGSSTTFSNSTPGGVWSVTNGSGTANITASGNVTGGTVGDVTVVYTVTNGSCSNSISRALTINPLLVKPSVGETIGVGCSNLGSVTLSNLPTGNWTLYQTGTASNSFNNTTLSETSYTVTGLGVGTYYFAVSNGTCTSTQTTLVTIGDQPTVTWNGTTWIGGIPDATKKAIVTSVTPNQPFTADITACSLIITSPDPVIVSTGVTLKITNAVTSNGQLTFKNNSSLVQINNVTNSGDIYYERTSTPIFQKDYIYWSTPVTPQRLIDVSPLTTSTKYFGNDGVQWVQTDRLTNMVIGKGYIIRGPANYNNVTKQSYTALFKGVPNNGDLQGELLEAGKYYLIGNPYPSALSADDLIDQNAILNGTIYLWTHNTPAKPTPTQQYTVDDYAAYNLSGGVSAKSDKDHNSNPVLDGGRKPTGFIAAGQAFYISVLPGPGGKVSFNNSMRPVGVNGDFFRNSNASKTAAIEKHRIWLNMTNTTGAFKQILVGYIQSATNEYDTKYDGISFDANPYLDFYSVNNNDKFIIQGRALPFTESDIIPLGYRTTTESDFTISIDEVDGSMNNQKIYLEDKAKGIIHDLTTSNYTFKTAVGTFTERFVLRYTSKTLGTGDFENIEDGILISVKNKTINVLSSKENIKDVTIFDITGKTLYSKNKVSNTELQIQNLPSSNQVLLVKVTLDNNATVTRKIIFQ